MLKKNAFKIISAMLLLLPGVLLAQVIRITGNVSTQKNSVKHAKVTFVDVNDTTNIFSALTDSLGNYSLDVVTKVHEPELPVPTNFDLEQNYPNPFLNETAITYIVRQPVDVSLKIYNVLGQEIKTYKLGDKSTGIHGIKWDGKDNFGVKVSAGIYFYMLQAGKEIQTKKMIFGLTSSAVNYTNPAIRSNLKYPKTVKAKTRQELLKRSNNTFRVEVINQDSTVPQIYSRVFKDIVIQGGTAVNLSVESVGVWEKINFSVENSLNDIEFVDDKHGWVIGEKGLILYSSDGGDSWEKQDCPLIERLTAVDFLDSKTGWILSQSHILKTTDGGKVWTINYRDSLWYTFYGGDIQFYNDSIGYVVCTRGGLLYGAIFKTTDGGETWQNITDQNLSYLRHISIVDESNIWICGYYPKTIISSSDSGLTWTSDPSIKQYCFTTIQFIDQENGWVGGRVLYKTTDRGNTWIEQKLPIISTRFDPGPFYFIDLQNGWIAPDLNSSTNGIFQTKNSGQTWELAPVNFNVLNICSIIFTDKDSGWAIGTEGKIENPENSVDVILRYKRE